jgi:hypothetical protein
VRSNTARADVEKWFGALGAGVNEGRGSRVRVYLVGVRAVSQAVFRAVFRCPYPQKETDKGALRSVRGFFVEAGFEPEK